MGKKNQKKMEETKVEAYANKHVCPICLGYVHHFENEDGTILKKCGHCTHIF